MDTGRPIEVEAGADLPLGMPVEHFLRDYWQKRPLLVRQAFPGFRPSITPDELGGLACEELALSRLIEHDRANDRWTVHTGPVDEALFARLPDRDWTLLVQDVDKWDAEVATLLEAFRFLPSWRIDDIMISYAEDGGGVGAHVDQYDVFLLQGLGRRQWRIDTRPDPPTAFREDVELRQLLDFNPDHGWTLHPGDMLYLPPGVPHDGVAEGPCMTLSIGMRAPSRAELLLDWSEHLAEGLPESARYRDPDLAPADAPGKIDASALARVRRSLGALAAGTDETTLLRWFGGFITRYRSAGFASPPPRVPDDTGLQAALANGQALARHPWSRMAWAEHQGRTLLFVAGNGMDCPPDLARRLCGRDPLAFATPLPAETMQVLRTLLDNGHLLLPDGAD